MPVWRSVKSSETLSTFEEFPNPGNNNINNSEFTHSNSTHREWDS